MIAAGAALKMIGFSAYGFVAEFPLFLAAMVVITFDEMLIVPVSQVPAPRFAPENMHGRNMVVFGLS